MSCTPDLNDLVDVITAEFAKRLREQIAPICGQRDQLAADVLRLREENRFLTGRLFFENSCDSAHDPDHGVQKRADMIGEDH